MMEDFDRAYGLRSARLRYFNAAGVDYSAQIGEDHSPEAHLTPLVLDVALGVSPAVQLFGTVYGTPDGTALRDYVHASDLARAHLLALQHLLDGGDSVAINLGRGEGISIVRWSKPSKRPVAGRFRYSKRHVGPATPQHWWQIRSVPRDVLGWKSERSDLSTIIADAWRWLSRRFGRQERARELAERPLRSQEECRAIAGDNCPNSKLEL